MGPSGAGKTTLLQIIGTLDQADQGQIMVDGVRVDQLSSKKLSDFRNQHIGFVFQFHQLLPEFTALENVMIPSLIAGKSQVETKQRAQELLQYMGLLDRARHKPSGSLDSKNKTELHQLFFDLRKEFGQTFVIVTHDEGLASITDRTIHMKDGRLIQTTPCQAENDAQCQPSAQCSDDETLHPQEHSQESSI